jgi:glycosyltransferase involved in cell wall biosynthesis
MTSSPADLAARRSSLAAPIKVAFCIDTMQFGGTELNAVRTAERLDRNRFDLRVICLQTSGPLLARYEAAGIPVHRFPIDNLYGPKTLRQAFAVARFLRGEGVSIVHSHDQYSNFFASLSARIARTPVIIASKRWGRPSFKYRVVAAAGFRLAHRVLANSGWVAQALEQEDGVSRRRIVVIPNFVDDSALAPPPPGWREGLLQELDLGGDVQVVGILARLEPIKDHASLLRAVAALAPRWPKLRLLLVGECLDGATLPALERLADELGIRPIVRFAGRRPQTPTTHHLFDISVLSSLSEGFPNSVVEAMAAGKPVVATRVGGIPDAVREGETGLLVPASSPDALAAAIESLLADPERRRRMGAAGQARVREEFLAGRVIGSLERFYEEMVARNAR